MSVTYEVEGMTCSHCAASVTRELRNVPGVQDVAVDVASKRVVVSTVAPIDDALVVAAVDEAGYRVTGRVG